MNRFRPGPDDTPVALLESEEQTQPLDATAHLARLLLTDPSAAQSFALQLERVDRDLQAGGDVQSIIDKAVSSLDNLFRQVDSLLTQNVVEAERRLQDARQKVEELKAKPLPEDLDEDHLVEIVIARSREGNRLLRTITASEERYAQIQSKQDEWQRTTRESLLSYMRSRGQISTSSAGEMEEAA